MNATVETVGKTAARRICFLDILRGIAIIYMVFYHTLFDLAMVFHAQWAVDIFLSQSNIDIWFTGTFVLLGGITIRFARNPAKHGARLLFFGAVFSLVTAVVFPGSAIYFGVLHLFAVSMLMYFLAQKWFCRLPWWLSSSVCLLLFALTFGVSQGYFGIRGLFELPVPHMLQTGNMLYPFGFIGSGFSSVDYLPILPWIFLFFAGAGLGSLLQRELPDALYKDFCPPISWLGRHSLAIYIIHQPVVYAVLYVIFKFID